MVGVALGAVRAASRSPSVCVLASYLLSNTLVPVLSAWPCAIIHGRREEIVVSDRARERYQRLITRAVVLAWPIIRPAYALIVCLGRFPDWPLISARTSFPSD